MMSAQTHKKAPPGEAGVGIQVKQAEEASRQLFTGSHDANVCRTLEGSCGENGPLQQRGAGLIPLYAGRAEPGGGLGDAW